MIELKQHPDDRLLYGIDYAPWLGIGQLITDSVWTVLPAGDLVFEESTVFEGVSTSLFISGGVDGVAYVLTNKITTDSTPINQIKNFQFTLLITKVVPT